MTNEEVTVAILDIMAKAGVNRIGAVIEDQHGSDNLAMFVTFEVCATVEEGHAILERYNDSQDDGVPTNATIQ